LRRDGCLQRRERHARRRGYLIRTNWRKWRQEGNKKHNAINNEEREKVDGSIYSNRLIDLLMIDSNWEKNGERY
jgi:hypothetical protein